MCHSYDVINLLRKQIVGDFRVFIHASTGCFSAGRAGTDSSSSSSVTVGVGKASIPKS